MHIIIRGHIRNAFETNELYNLIKYLSEKYTKIEIYIHTWSIKQNNISWRKIDNDYTEINNKYIESYFKDLYKYIKYLIIEDDENIILHGNLEGKILLTKTYILGWKRYIYGNYKITKYLYEKNNNSSDNLFLLNIRFDLFTNSYTFPYNEIIDFIDKNYNNNIQKNIENNIQNNIENKNIFLRDGEYCGIDNIIIGTIKTNYKLFSLIYYKLDEILLMKENENLKNPEFIIPRVNNFCMKE